MIFDYKKMFVITALLSVLCGCSSVSGKIGNTSITDQEAEQLYNAFEKLEKHEIGEIPLIGGGDINVSITVGNENISIAGSSPFGLIITDKVYIADPFNSFFDINTELREKYDLTVSLIGISDERIYHYDANEIVSQWVKDWQYDEDICFDIYYVGKNVSVELLGNMLSVQFPDNGTISDYFRKNSKSGSLKYENVEIKERKGTSLLTEEDDCYYMVRLEK